MNISTTRIALLLCAAACSPKPGGDTDDLPTPTTTTTTGTGTTVAPTTTSNDTDRPEDPCTLVPDGGACEAAFDRYFFDPQTGRCDVFIWGGCDGVVPFDDVESCQQACEPCEAFAGDVTPAPSHPEIGFTVRNDSAAPIFLRTFTPDSSALGFRDQIFEVRTAGASEPLITNPSLCDFPCAHFDNAECSTGCTDGGSPPPPILISPGGVFTGSWSGLYFDNTAMPARCQPAACEGELECGRWFDAWPGSHEVTVTVATGWECLGVDCGCTGNADGWCQLPGNDEPGALIDPQTLTAGFTFPGDAPVALSFP